MKSNPQFAVLTLIFFTLHTHASAKYTDADASVDKPSIDTTKIGIHNFDE